MAEDRDLIRRTLGGDREAFDELVRRYQDGLFRHLLRLSGNPGDAEDLCQESFLAFYKALGRFNLDRPIAPFLFTIATNAWRMQVRKAIPEALSLGEQEPSSHISVSDKALEHLEFQQVLAAMARLQPEQREVVSLYYDQGLSYKEISRITRVPMGTVSGRLHRAIEALRRALLPEGAGAGLVIAVGGSDKFSTNLVSALQGQAHAPASLLSAVVDNVAQLAPAAVGILSIIGSLWKEAILMAKIKAVHVVVGLAIVGGATFGTVELVHHFRAARPSSSSRTAPMVYDSQEPVSPSVDENLVNARETVNHFWQAVINKDYEQATKYSSAVSFPDRLNEFSAKLKSGLEPLGLTEIISIDEAYYDPETKGRILVPYRVKGREEISGNAILRKEDPKLGWLIDGGI